jgi:DNA modification methylase
MKIMCSHSDVVDIDTLVPHPRNPNSHSEKQVKLLAKILNHQGWRHPVTVSKRSGFVVSGHGRLEAARMNGWEQVPVDQQDFATEADEYAHLIADNKIAELADLNLRMVNEDVIKLGEFDFDLLGIPDFELVEINNLDAQCDPDEMPDKVEPRTKLGDIYKLGNHRLMCGDSTSIDAVEKLMGGEKADFGFCDPPYNLGFSYNEYDDNKTDQEYIDFSASWFNCLSIVSERQAVTLGTKNIPIMSNLGKVAGVACWVKKNWITSCHISKLQQWEPIFFYGDFTKLKRTSDLYEINRVHQKDVGNSHSCPKQIALIEDIFENYCVKSIVDLFGGSGTSMIAAEKLGKKSYLMELDPHYCDVIVARWEKYTGKTATSLTEEKQP